MFTLFFILLMLGLMWQIFKIGIKAAWGITKFLVSFAVPVILILIVIGAFL